VKSDRNDARGIAQLMRLGWFRPVHCKSLGAQEVRALLSDPQMALALCQISAQERQRHANNR
jgi:transposase